MPIARIATATLRPRSTSPSACSSFATISSGLGRFFDIDPSSRLGSHTKGRTAALGDDDLTKCGDSVASDERNRSKRALQIRHIPHSIFPDCNSSKSRRRRDHDVPQCGTRKIRIHLRSILETSPPRDRGLNLDPHCVPPVTPHLTTMRFSGHFGFRAKPRSG
jgi:hypothetical protein